MTPLALKPPILTIVAGPNGSGKSTVTGQLGLRDTMPVLDPDAVACLLNPSDPSRADIAAGREVLSRWRQLIERRANFAVETTLAGIGPIERIRQAKLAGYQIRVYYVAIDTAELNVERVRRRVLQGGHNIPESAIRRRYRRSLANAPVAIALADNGSVVDNTFHQAITVLELEAGRICWQAPSLPGWVAKIVAAIPKPNPSRQF